MRHIIIISISLILANHLAVYSQSAAQHQLIEEIIGDLASVDDTEADPAVLYDELLFYILHPLNINISDASELRNLHFLNELQVANLIEYRRKNNEFATVYELQYIEGFSHDDIRKILPFIFIGEKGQLYNITAASTIRHGSHQYFLRLQRVLQEQRGFSPISDTDLAANPNSRYLGSPLKIYNRYQFAYRNQVHAGFVAEKDAGEEFFSGSNPQGFDFISMHLQVNDVGRFRTIAIGDFQPGFGQGLVLWSGLAFSKSANTLNVRKNARGIQKYSSTDENMFMRGAGVTYSFSGNAEGSLFISRKKIDAAVSLTDHNGKVTEVSSLQNTGLHATPSQMAGKDILGETVFGGNFTYNHTSFKIGATYVMLEYDAVFNPPERIYNQFDFRGSRNSNMGIDYQFSLGPLRVFGENAVSASGGLAMLSGVIANLSPVVSMSGIYRNYSRNYHAYFSNGFSENTRTANENGFYLGTLIHPFKQWKLSAYFDFFSFPWMRYGVYFPSSGNEYFLQVDYNHSRNLHMYLSFKNKYKPLNTPAGESHLRELDDIETSRVRYHVNYVITPVLEFRNRLELSFYKRENNPSEKGFLLYQDILYRPVKFPFSFAFRYAVYDTESYNTRLYAYENDVLYAFSNSAYYDNGFRSYLLVQYTAGRSLDIWLRYAITKLPGKENLGSGLNIITGDARSEIKAQVRLRF